MLYETRTRRPVPKFRDSEKSPERVSFKSAFTSLALFTGLITLIAPAQRDKGLEKAIPVPDVIEDNRFISKEEEKPEFIKVSIDTTTGKVDPKWQNYLDEREAYIQVERA